MVGLVGAWLAQSYASLRLSPQGLYAWFNVIFLAPLLEEWALRSVLLRSLVSLLERHVSRHARWVANGVVSTLFVIVHQSAVGQMAWLWFFPSWVLGMVWFRFESLWACAITHAWFNVALILISILGAQSAQAQTAVPTLTSSCTMNSTALLTAESAWADKKLQASVFQEADRWVLHVAEVLSSGDMVCMHNSNLLGKATTTRPVLVFNAGFLLSVWWHLPQEEVHGRQEVFEMVFDAQRNGWPLVRYRHKLVSVNASSGVDADLEQYVASWTQLDPGETRPRLLTGPLQPLPLQPLSQVPFFADYALQPVGKKIYHPQGR